MKTLLLLRHAKSSWKNPGLNDHDRPLNKRGKRDAPRMGRLLREAGLLPDVILSSTAERARTTAQKVAEAAAFQGELKLNQHLYAAPPQTLVRILQQVPDGSRRVMIVAHNPGLQELLSALTDCDEPFPTAALARVTLPVDHWQDVTLETKGTLADLWRPKELAD